MSSIFDGREVYKPYDFPEVEKNFTEPIQDGYWVHRELEFDKDVQNYRTDLTESDRQIISRILRTFAEVEVHVADDLWSKIGRFLPRPEFCEMGYAFAENESRHASAYFRINEVLNLKEFEKKINFTGSVYFRHTTNVIQRVKIFNSNSTSTVTFANIDQSQSAGLELVVSYKPTKWWRNVISFNGSLIEFTDNTSNFNYNNLFF
jgi:ribonucleotide reductase beta subunit family protein with ferritin-like domain